MNKKIASIYKNSFADDISEIDAAYFFSEILKKKLNLEDEELPQTISQLKDQTEQHINTLNTVFNNVLHRDADVFEKEHYIFYFRDGYTNNGKAQIADCRYKSSIRIENELYDSMEYQDVLKEWLKDSLKIKNHSVLYKVMLYITKLEDKELIRNKNNLLEGLKKVFENYF
jgi:rubrerythrin